MDSAILKNLANAKIGQMVTIRSLDVESVLQEQLFGMGLRIDSAIKVVSRLRKKLVLMLPDNLRIALDEPLAASIMVSDDDSDHNSRVE